MNTMMKSSGRSKSHFVPPLALLQLLLVALFVFAAGTGGTYNLSLTNTATGVAIPIVSTTNGDYVTNYAVISLPESVTFTVAPPVNNNNFTVGFWDFNGAGNPSHISGNNTTVMSYFASTNTPIAITPVTLYSSRTDDASVLCTTAQQVLQLLPDQITLNGYPISATNNTVCVGEQVCLTNIISGVPASAVTSHQWGLPGTTFKNYGTNSIGEFTGVLTTNATTDLANPYVNTYWADGGTNRVIYCTNVIYGQTNVISAALNVVRPVASIDHSDCNATAKVDDTWTGFPLNNTNYIQAVHFGDGLTTAMDFKANITAPAGFTTGHYVWIQMINGVAATIVSGGQTFTLGPATNILDNPAPYTHTVDGPIADSPGLPLKAGQSGGFSVDNFTTYLMWEPNTPNAQYVPVRKISWGWTGYGTCTNGTNWTSSNLFGPGTLSDVDATNHPTWTQVFTNLQWSPYDPNP